MFLSKMHKVLRYKGVLQYNNGVLKTKEITT
jgi:hypothetical protein